MPESFPIEQFKIIDSCRDTQDVADLAASIAQLGLLEPIIVQERDGWFEVVDGRRRLTAMQLLKFRKLYEHVHYRIDRKNDPLVVQLAANLDRRDFNFMEIASLVYAIHERFVQIHGKGIPGRRVGGWSYEATAKLIGRDKSFVSRYLMIWKHKDLVEDCSTFTEALKRIKADRVRKILARIQEEKEKKAIIAPDLQSYLNNVAHASAKSFIESLETGTVDLVLTKLPLSAKHNELPDQELIELFEGLAPEFYRVLKKDKFLIIFVSYQAMQPIRESLKNVAFSVWEVPLIWLKTGVGGEASMPGILPRCITQPALLAFKGTPSMTAENRTNVFMHPVSKNRPEQLPESLLAELLQAFSAEGDIVLDTFAGELPIMRACYATHRRYMGCESDKGVLSDGIAYSQEWIKVFTENVA